MKSSSIGVRRLPISLTLLLAVGIYSGLLVSRSAGAQREPKGDRFVDSPVVTGKVPGNPELTVRQMKLLHTAMERYRKRHDGAYPTKFVDFLNDVDHDAGYGIKSEEFLNPDCRYSDIAAFRLTGKGFPYVLRTKRMDGTSAGSSKMPGTRDVIAYCDLYYHSNYKYEKGQSSMRPVGFVLVLWDDGQVEKVGWERLKFGKQEGSWKYVFDHEAGAPSELRAFKEVYRGKYRTDQEAAL